MIPHTFLECIVIIQCMLCTWLCWAPPFRTLVFAETRRDREREIPILRSLFSPAAINLPSMLFLRARVRVRGGGVSLLVFGFVRPLCV